MKAGVKYISFKIRKHSWNRFAIQLFKFINPNYEVNAAKLHK
jgi:hypothetical protein